MNLVKRVNSLITTPKNIIESAFAPAIAGLGLISIPLIAMQFTAEVVWTVFDFGIAWSLIFGAGFTFQLVSKKTENSAYKIATGLAVFASLAILWVNGAVGIIGNESNPLNLLFGVVLMMVVFGSYIAKLEAKGMSRVMVVTAVTQILITFSGTMIHLGQNPGYQFSGILRITMIFTVVWLLASLFYRRAGMLEE